MNTVALACLLAPAIALGEPVTGLDDPAVEPPVMPRDAGSIEWRPVRGPLFTDRGPTAEDIAQHGAGDCYLMAALSELARMYPATVRRMIRDDGDGTFTVALFAGPVRGAVPKEPPAPVAVRVDRRLPTRGGKLVYSNRATTSALWPELVEKAWAKLHGGYEVIGHGGNAANAFRGLAAFRVTEYRIDALPGPKLWSIIQSAIADGDSVVAGTRAEEAVRPLGLLGNHAYAVLSARVTGPPPNDVHLLLLRNPLARGGDRGEREIRIVQLQKGFSSLVVARPDR